MPDTVQALFTLPIKAKALLTTLSDQGFTLLVQALLTFLAAASTLCLVAGSSGIYAMQQRRTPGA